DIINVDITAYLDGVHGDTDATFCVGEVSEEARLLVERTHEAMMRGIKAVRPGRKLNVIGRVIESYARRFGYGVVRDFTGHGCAGSRRPGRAATGTGSAAASGRTGGGSATAWSATSPGTASGRPSTVGSTCRTTTTRRWR